MERERDQWELPVQRWIYHSAHGSGPLKDCALCLSCVGFCGRTSREIEVLLQLVVRTHRKTSETTAYKSCRRNNCDVASGHNPSKHKQTGSVRVGLHSDTSITIGEFHGCPGNSNPRRCHHPPRESRRVNLSDGARTEQQNQGDE